MLTLLAQPTSVELTPAQQAATERLLTAIRAGDVVALKAVHGAGRTTEFLSVLAGHQAAAIEEAFVSLLDAALARHSLAILNYFHLIAAVVSACDL